MRGDILTYNGIISCVYPNSIAADLGIVAGDTILKVNGESVRDIIDLSFALADENIEILIKKNNGAEVCAKIDKEYDQDLGVEFESAVFDGVRKCANNCIFCFVDQMAPNLRESLYVKDDDYRLSFLYGNFITLTNLTEADINRIRQLHLSPLYVSVHTTNGPLREKMLNNKNAGNIVTQLNNLIDNGVQLHTQVVLCPNINDGKYLEETIKDLYALHPEVLSMAIVPVGLSRFRESCYPLEVFTSEQAQEVITIVSNWQKHCRQQSGESFVYLADEFYLVANSPIPEYEIYDDFPQIENGVGMVRNFIAEWENVLTTNNDSFTYEKPTIIDIVCGISAEKVLQPLLANLKIPNLTLRLIPVTNRFFGEHITVSGLLTGQDILQSLQCIPDDRDGIIIPGVALRSGEDIFLDDLNVHFLEEKTGVSVTPAYNATDMYRLVTQWNHERKL